MIVRLFKPRFAPLVESGKKKHTVRPKPKRMPKVGDVISLREWTGKPYRSKQRELRRSTITKVERIMISLGGILLAGRPLTHQECNDFAKADGFQAFDEMLCWFAKEHGGDRFDGIVIYWQ